MQRIKPARLVAGIWSGKLIALLMLWMAFSAVAHLPPRNRALDRALADALFTNGMLLHLKIELHASNVAALARTPKQYVPGVLREGNAVYTDVGIHLKGSAGSFRNINDKPGFTLNFGTFEASSNFHGLKKFHLNNCVQDPTYLSDWLCNSIFREAGVPAPFCAHALVELNGRKLGLYALMESNDRDFLGRYFKNTQGNLYGRSGHGDVSDELERMSGKGPLDRADLKALVAACRERDPAKRWAALQKNLDVDRFLSFMALETMICDWDGYTAARHNYRIYQDLDTGRMVFFPHDKDQVLGNPDQPVIIQNSPALVAQAMLNTPEGRQRYRERSIFLITNVFNSSVLIHRVDWLVGKLRPQLQATDRNFAANFSNQANGLKGRIMARAKGLEKQFHRLAPAQVVQRTAPPQKPPARPTLPANSKVTKLAADASTAQWVPVQAQNASKLQKVQLAQQPALYIKSEQANCVGAWRAEIVLRSGRYRFSGRAKTRGLVAQRMPFGTGGGLRISGSNRNNQISGDKDWTLLQEEFVVPADGPVRLFCELRANQGEIWFDLQSLKIERLH